MASRVKSVYILGWLSEYLRTTGSVSVVISGDGRGICTRIKIAFFLSTRHFTKKRTIKQHPLAPAYVCKPERLHSDFPRCLGRQSLLSCRNVSCLARSLDLIRRS